MQMKTKTVPESYRHIGTPMMPKVKNTTEVLEHRGLAIFSLLWRIESVAWYSKLEIWQESMEIPCVAIGGITVENAAPLVTAGADFIAVSAGVWDHPDGAPAAVAAFNALFDSLAAD